MQRELLALLAPGTDDGRWAMVQTNLGLSLLERARALDRRLQSEHETDAEAKAMISQAVEHFQAALTWRSFERGPEDWAYTQINLALAYQRAAGGDRSHELELAVEHNGEAIRGFAAARRPTHLSQALSNRSSARLALAQLQDEHTVENHDLLDAAETDASEAISVLGDDVHGVDAGRRWWQLGRVLAARDGYSPSMMAAFERALAVLTPETAPSDCRDAARHLADLASGADDWERAASAWRQAADAGAALVQTRATLAGRLSQASANGTLARWAAYALVQIGSLAEAIEVLERGRALQLATWLGRGPVRGGNHACRKPMRWRPGLSEVLAAARPCTQGRNQRRSAILRITA